MYKVLIGHECACFKKSEYPSEKTFDKQQDAYQYANILSELMNEDFCTTHLFTPEVVADSNFVITVTKNPNAGSSCGTTESSCSSGSCGC